ncbi:phosphatidylinositol 4,5-bisphosphate 3-kinase catalytic subunit delta isoform isoform X2 [Bacillus rossius redtenbacheri]|uniref:phosphatidylinositol 4,5-bisphosphate 3-kinase catalytic subunit delta isoform isoform X2 n=1 Tax=Bacillus rossius redtenbacheri TaxID=93214 RepID=UPI002FDE9A67
MVHKPATFAYDFWLRGNTEPQVELSCLMPNGVHIPIEANRDATLQEIKELWEEASKFPLHWMLHDSSAYVFSCITSMAEVEELLDETRRLCDIRPFCCIFRIIERRGDSATDEKTLDVHISQLIGKPLTEFDQLKNTEVNDFRFKMKMLGEETAAERRAKSWAEKVRYQFPARLADMPDLPPAVAVRLRDGNFALATRFEDKDMSFTFNVPCSMTPRQLLQSVLNKRSITLNSRDESVDELVLKVAGREEYLVGDCPLVRFQYVRDMLARDACPLLVMMSAGHVPVDAGSIPSRPESSDGSRARSHSTMTYRRRGRHMSSWDIEKAFTFQVCAMSRLNCDTSRVVEVGVQAGLFHGGKALSEPQKTSEKPVSKEGCCEWDEDLEFDLQVRDIPRMARLCLVVYETSKTAKGIKSKKLKDSKQDLNVNPLAWVNTTVYDFKNMLKTGAMTLYMWTYAEDIQSDDLLHPLGTIVSNPNVEQATTLTLTFHRHHSELTVMYPSLEAVLSRAEQLREPEAQQEPREDGEAGEEKEVAEEEGEGEGGDEEGSGLFPDSLRGIADNPLHELHEQERRLIWDLRYSCLRHHPTLLPKLLDCVEWNDHTQVCEVTYLLQKWPKLPVEKALELLDYAYADQEVRSFAVRCLHDASDDEVLLFLLQLVQAVKHESYLSCDLVEFLLKRALNNQKIGHYLFWHLRSEMQVASVSVRFGLMLEAYCRGCQEHMRALQRQATCLEKLKEASKAVRLVRDKDKARAALQKLLTEEHYKESFSKFVNPLDPSFRCTQVWHERCRVMDSKMRPLWIILENADRHGEDIYLIFKNGDDLRQDMLTLQMIRIMDKLWKNEGLDLRMNPYGCVSTEHRVGLIEVVLNAETIANIQKEKGMLAATSAFRKGSLLAWLKDHNPTDSALNKAIEDFTLSCAGYSVATYVLGVADRHSDNIMVKRTGQLFHIDFGHILGHFKEKFGFRRERVPFVLTHDFVHVINKGQTTKKEAREFEVFQKCCEDAFLVLRKHGRLILSLFAMMISTGLPELSSEKDLNYLRDTLVLDMTEEDARQHFKSKFDEALSNSWKTSLNWATHNISKNNNQ